MSLTLQQNISMYKLQKNSIVVIGGEKLYKLNLN